MKGAIRRYQLRALILCAAIAGAAVLVTTAPQAGAATGGSLSATWVPGAFSAPGGQLAGADKAFFPHSKPGHQKVDCAHCHTITPEKIDETAFPGHAACVTCHNLALEAIARPVAYCGICHNGRAVSKTQPALFSYPKQGAPHYFGIDFSHPSHMKPQPSARLLEEGNRIGLEADRARNPSCLSCHATLTTYVTMSPRGVEHRTAGELQVGTDTGHPACFVCHGQDPIAQPAMSQCAGCHKLAGPQYPALRGIVPDFKHSDHVYDTRPIIKAVVKSPRRQDYLCSECHDSAASAARLGDIRLPQRANCETCHNGNIGLPDPLMPRVLDSLNFARRAN